MACQIFAVTDEASLAYGVQTACGTPQTALIQLRYTSESLALTTAASQSNEIRDDRNVTDLIRTSASVGGAVGMELSYKTFDKFFEGLLQSDTALDGLTGAVIKNGTTKKYFTFERNTPSGGVDYFTSFSDMQIASLDLTIQQGSPIEGTWTLLGQVEPVISAASLDIDGYTASNTNPIFNTVEGVGTIQIDGVDVGSVQGLTLTIGNNLREQRALGSVAPAGVASGKFTVTGNISIYFVNNDLVQKFIDDQLFDLLVTIQDSTPGATHGNQYTIHLKSCKFSNATNAVAGVGQDVLLQGDFQAIYNSTDLATMTLSATDAA